MAEALLRFVLGKLANIIEKEMELLGGVGKKVEQVQRELTRIQCCLRDADSKRKGDARVQNWLNELRDVTYRIEDATDTFFLKVEDHRQKDPSFLQKLKKLSNKPLEVSILHKLGNELDDIQNALEEISKSRVNYGIEPLQDKGKGEAIILPFRRATYQEVDETEVEDLQADKNNILKLLRLEETPRRTIITIVGIGGVGKTTLAHMVYKSARAEFKYHIMLSISQQFSLTDLLIKMIRQLKDFVPKNHEIGDLICELRSLIGSRRYLIVLDDVWRVNLWHQLKDALPDVKNGSRVLMTSRSIDIARSADPDMEPYVLHCLNDRESLDLLLKKAFGSKNHDEYCPSDLCMVAGELSKRCKGLPLALMVLGGILSTREQSYPVWKRVLQTLDWHLNGKDCMEVLAMSYEDMPYYLKACFLYLASFPEDYKISAKRLIRMWVAEGFIPCEGRTIMEEIAEDWLEKLFQRSMIQVSSRCMNGSIKFFQVHDLLHDLAMHEAMHENFVTVFSQASDINQPNRRIRRASLQYQLQAQQRNPRLIMEYVGPNTRSLLWFELGLFEFKLSNFRLLKVLEIVGVGSYVHDLIRVLDELIYLKYFGLKSYTGGINFSTCSFRGTKNLETIDVRGTSAVLPNVIWTISTLRHVLYDGFDLRSELSGPTSTTHLGNLQTMRWILAPKSWAWNLPLLDNLHKLGVRHYLNEWVGVTNLLQTLPSLVSLGIQGTSLPVEIVYPKALPNYQNLQSLDLQGRWSENVTLEASLFPPYLVKLTLRWSRLKQNPLSELGKLKSLKKLCLREEVLLNYGGPTICSEGFPVLQYLEVVDRSIEDLKVAKGVMPKLRYLQVPPNIKLHLPPELQHVTVSQYPY